MGYKAMPLIDISENHVVSVSRLKKKPRKKSTGKR
jgi:hypothetical protein